MHDAIAMNQKLLLASLLAAGLAFTGCVDSGPSPDIVGTYGSGTYTTNGTTQDVAAALTPFAPYAPGDDTPEARYKLDYGWGISFVAGGTPGSPCDFGAVSLEVEVFALDHSSQHALTVGNYAIGDGDAQPPVGRSGALLTEVEPTGPVAGVVVITEADDRHVTGFFSATVGSEIAGTFTANRCYE